MSEGLPVFDTPAPKSAAELVELQQKNDDLLKALKASGVTAEQINDAKLEFYKANGATSDQINDAAFEYWEATL